MQNKSKINPIWGGAFSRSSTDVLKNINQSIAFDQRLAKQDILASKAHCKMLAKAHIISQVDFRRIIAGLNKLEKKYLAGKIKFKSELEDVHMNIEAMLTQEIGRVAGKLHTARSRNDQVVTDFKLWIREAYDILDESLHKLQAALIKKAELNIETIMPGFTHMQSAQPVSFGHHLMAYFEMFKRDRSRIKNARNLMNECPLGAAALAGTSFSVDRHMVAKELGFTKPTANSLDTVSDRDFVLEYLSVVAICAIHLSRLADELVLWCSKQFDFIKFSEAFTTGSSIMPQKRNPDAAELVRAKVGRVVGNLNCVLMVMKGLPLAYSKDLQEDKEPVFDAHDIIIMAIDAITGMIYDLTVNKEKMLQAASAGYTTATDLADWLVKKQGIPFRTAHGITGKIVKVAEKKGCELKDLTLSEMQAVEPRINKDIYSVITIEASLKSKTSLGGTAPKKIREAIMTAKKNLII